MKPGSCNIMHFEYDEKLQPLETTPIPVKLLSICLRPESRPSVFAFFCFWIISWWGGGWGSGVGLLTSFFFVLHDLRSDPFFYFVAHTSCYLGYVFSTSLHTLHVTLDTSSLLRCTHTHTLHVTLDTSCLGGGGVGHGGSIGWNWQWIWHLIFRKVCVNHEIKHQPHDAAGQRPQPNTPTWVRTSSSESVSSTATKQLVWNSLGRFILSNVDWEGDETMGDGPS